MNVLELKDSYNHYTWYFIPDKDNIYTYNFGGNKELKKYDGTFAEFQRYLGAVLIDGICEAKNISDNLDLHFLHIAERVNTLIRDGRQSDLFKTVSAVYTGGGIWLFHGQLTSGDYFLVDDNGCIIVLDESPEDFDVSLYDKWQEKHFIRWIEGQEQKVFLHSMIDRVGKRLPVDDSGGITDDELDTLNDLWRYTV